MARGKCFILMVGFIKVNGNKISFVGSVNCSIPPIN